MPPRIVSIGYASNSNEAATPKFHPRRAGPRTDQDHCPRRPGAPLLQRLRVRPTSGCRTRCRNGPSTSRFHRRESGPPRRSSRRYRPSSLAHVVPSPGCSRSSWHRPARARRRTGSTYVPRIGARLIISPPEVTALPAGLCPPPRTEISRPSERAEAHGVGDVGGVEALGDQRRSLVDQPVVDGTGSVVAGIARLQNLARKLRPEPSTASPDSVMTPPRGVRRPPEPAYEHTPAAGSGGRDIVSIGGALRAL